MKKKCRNIINTVTLNQVQKLDFNACENKRNVLNVQVTMRNLAYSTFLFSALIMSSCNLAQRGNINTPQEKAAAANAVEDGTSSSLSGTNTGGVDWRGNKHFAYVLSPEDQCNIPIQEQSSNPWDVTENGNAGGARPWEVNSGTSAGRITAIAIDDSFTQGKRYGTVLNNGSSIVAPNGQQIVGRGGQTLSGINFSSNEREASNISVSPFKVWITQRNGLYGIPFDRNSGSLDFSYRGREVRFSNASQPMNLVTSNVIHVNKNNTLERREYVFASFTGIPKIGYVINKEQADTGRALPQIARVLDFSNQLSGTQITSLNTYGDLLAVGFQQGAGRGATVLCKILYLTNEMPEPAIESQLDNTNLILPHGCWLRNTVAQEQAPIDNWFSSSVGWISVTPTYGVMIMPDVQALIGKGASVNDLYQSSVIGNTQNGIVHVTLRSDRRDVIDRTDSDNSFKKAATGQNRTIIGLQNNGNLTAYSLDNIIATQNGEKESILNLGSQASDMAMAPGTLQQDGTYIRNGGFMVVNQAQRGSVMVLPVIDGLPSAVTQDTEVFTRCAGHRIGVKPMIESDYRY